MTLTARLRASSLAASLLVAAPLFALVNPSLQPSHLVERYRTVARANVETADLTNGLITLKVTDTFRGDSIEAKLVLSAEPSDDSEPSAFLNTITEGEPVVVFLGSARRASRTNEGLLYSSQYLHEIKRSDDPAKPNEWQVTKSLGDEMWGTYNGDAGQLAAMLADTRDGRVFFPAIPFVRFAPERTLDTLNAPARGLAVLDFNNDGLLDVLAASPSGVRILLQNKKADFIDATTSSGLTDLTARSVGAADFDGDGRIDLVLDGVIYRATGPATYARTDWGVPAQADKTNTVLNAQAADLDADGRPDLLVALTGGGLHARLNLQPGKPLVDATATLGLDQPDSGAAAAGYFTLGDLNGDGRLDIFFAAGTGYVLRGGPKGFTSTPAPRGMSFANATDPAQASGGGSIISLWGDAARDLVAAGDNSLWLLGTRPDGGLNNNSAVGNEVRIGTNAQLAVLAEDLNADGRVDLLTLSRAPGGGANFHSNRGYGSYMKDSLYVQYDAFPGKVWTQSLSAAVAADMDGDGALDLVLAAEDGRVVLARNACLDERAKLDENPAQQQQVLAGVVRLRVRLPAATPPGAEITVRTSDGRVIGQRSVGLQTLTGSRSPDEAIFALRVPGPYTIEARLAGGRVLSQSDVKVAPGTFGAVELSAP